MSGKNDNLTLADGEAAYMGDGVFMVHQESEAGWHNVVLTEGDLGAMLRSLQLRDVV